jgi:hypothetical protein
VIEINCNKIFGLNPEWALFRGWSLVFEPFGFDGLESDRESYKAARRFVGSFNPLPYGLFLLPPETYHVTACDLLCEENYARLDNESHYQIANSRMHKGTRKGSAIRAPEFIMEMIKPDIEHMKKYLPIKMRNHRLVIGENALKLSLIPDPFFDDGNYFELVKIRQQLAEKLNQLFRCPLQYNSAYYPHITLGYFANKTLKMYAEARLHEWNEMNKKTMECGITLDNISMYYFTDMASWERVAIS